MTHNRVNIDFEPLYTDPDGFPIDPEKSPDLSIETGEDGNMISRVIANNLNDTTTKNQYDGNENRTEHKKKLFEDAYKCDCGKYSGDCKDNSCGR